MSNKNYFKQRPNIAKDSSVKRTSSEVFQPKTSITNPPPSILGLETISKQIKDIQTQGSDRADTYEHRNIYSSRDVLSVKTENTYFSNFAPNTGVPFAKDSIYLGLNGDNDKKEQYFDFFKVPDKRALFITYLECRLAPYKLTGTPVPTAPYRFTNFGGDDEFALYGLGFSLVANKTISSFLSQEVVEDTTAATYNSPPNLIFGSYYVYNQNVLNNNTSPMYLSYLENLNVRVLMQWRDFPTGLGSDANVETYAVLVRARGYLFNMNDYYRFIDSVRAVDSSPLKPII